MMYCSCRYAPVELFAGFGVEVKRLDPVVSDFSCAETCTHPNLCGYAKALYEQIVEENIQELVLTDCCDATRRLYDALASGRNMRFLWLLPLPHKDGKEEVALFARALEELKDAYAASSGKTFDLSAAQAAFARKTQEKHPLPKQPWIRIAGAHASAILTQEVQNVFGTVPVINETCAGERTLPCIENEGASFFLAYAASLLKQPRPCMRMQHGEEKEEMDPHLLGTVYHTIKFCDYYSFAYMEERHRGKPLIKIETDATMQSSGQLKTRLEAFREELNLPAPRENIMQKQEKKGKIYTAGIDSGSSSTDAVILDAQGKILGTAVVPTGAGAADGARKALMEALHQAGLQESDITRTVTTGYGRSTIQVGETAVTEITCHARGAHYLDPEVRTVIDIGGQDSKVIRIDEKGHVQNFVMNDKCAAGTGRFLEMQARVMGMTMEEMSQKGLSWKNDVTISSMCTVFAESEVVSLVAENVAPADIIHGLNKAIAAKTASLAARADGIPVYMMTGGVARNQGVVDCLSRNLHEEVRVSPYAQVCGSLGAALIALEALGINPEQL